MVDYTEEIFAIKQKFLQTIPHPKLIVKQIKRVEQIIENQGAVALEVAENPMVDIELSINLDIFLEEYTNQLLKLKLQIANSSRAQILRNYLVTLEKLQNQLITKLAQYAPKDTENVGVEVKMSTPFDVYEILKFIQAEKLEENQIKPYLYAQITGLSSELNPLLIACIRAEKIEQHGR
jgi:pseudouridine-5'-phosphate glycosidase